MRVIKWLIILLLPAALLYLTLNGYFSEGDFSGRHTDDGLGGFKD